ncbi:HAD-IA family hydrolase [Candidatus Micrarchaeota archaeon]|nr:HAD-IA family hydrolase [Candidatus Micrarchaeota archaeon]
MKPASPIQAVLFDVDGVLLESHDALLNLYQDFAREFGLHPLAPKDILQHAGLKDEDWVRALAPEFSETRVHAAASWCERNYAETYIPLFARPAPGAKELLYHLQARKIKKAIVTNQSAAQAVASQKLIDYRGFDTVVTWEDVVHAKPSPEPLLKALDRLNVAPENAIYLGDTAVDVQAGKAAGIRTLILQNKENATLECDKIAQLDDLLVKLYNA